MMARPLRAFWSARHARLQTILAVCAIAAAVALPVVLVSVGGGVSAHELSEIQQTGYEISVSAAAPHGVQGSHGLSSDFLSISEVQAASPVLSGSLYAFPPGTTKQTPLAVEGVIPDQFTPTLGPTEAGLFPQPLPLGDPTDLIHFANGTYDGPASNDVVLAGTVAGEYGLAVGDQLPLGPSPDRAEATTYTITGEFTIPTESFGFTSAVAVALLPLSNLQLATGFARGGTNGTFLVDGSDTVQVALAGSSATNPAAIASVANQIQAEVPYYGVTTLTQQAEQLQGASAILTGFYLALSSVGLAVGLIFLAIVLVRRVEAEGRSIGIRRAIGVPGRTIAAEMAGRAVLIAAVSAAIGTLVGILVISYLATYAGGAVQEAASLAQYDVPLLSAIALGVLGLAAAASLIATRAALRLNLGEALR